MNSFEELADHLAKTYHSEDKCAVHEKDVSWYRNGDYTVKMCRQWVLEKQLETYYPNGNMYAYTMNPFEEDRLEWCVSLCVDNQWYTVIAEVKLPDVPLVFVQYWRNRQENPALLRGTGNDVSYYDIIDEKYPDIHEHVLALLTEVPSYRLHFVTGHMKVRLDTRP